MSIAELSPTVYGIEDEKSVTMTFPGDLVYEYVGQCHSVDQDLGLYVEPQYTGGSKLDPAKFKEALEKQGLVRTHNGMLSNGGRLYFDPSGPEYATPECTTAEEAVHRSFEGDRILLGVLAYLRDKNVIESFQLNRRIVDHNRSSRGVHLNTCTNIPEDHVEAVVTRLAALNVAKGALFGSGGLMVEENGETVFHHSPRLSLTDAFSNGSYRARPLLRRPFKRDGPKLYRIETVTSDALNFAWPLRASLVATNALVKFLELNKPKSDLPILNRPIIAAKTVGRYGDARNITMLVKGRHYRLKPGAILKTYAEVLLKTDEKEGYLDDEARQVLPEIISVYDSMTKDMFSVVDQVESVARLYATERRMEQTGASIGSETICKYDYRWDMVGGGVAEQWRNDKLKGWQGFSSTRSIRPSQKQITTPPQDTRAKVRGEIVRRDGAKNPSDWDKLSIDEKVRYFHPLATEVPKGKSN